MREIKPEIGNKMGAGEMAWLDEICILVEKQKGLVV